MSRGNFNNDLERSNKLKPVVKPHIRQYYEGLGLRIVGDVIDTCESKNHLYLDKHVGADWLIEVVNKEGTKFVQRVDDKIRRNKYYERFLQDNKVVIEIRDRNNKGWLQKTGTKIMYGFSNLSDTQLVGKPIFFPVCEGVQELAAEEERLGRVLKSYDGTEFVLIDAEKLIAFEKKDVGFIIGDSEVSQTTLGGY